MKFIAFFPLKINLKNHLIIYLFRLGTVTDYRVNTSLDFSHPRKILKLKLQSLCFQDESHFLKSHKAQCTIALTAIARCAARVVLLSGTPALSRPAELHTQLELIEKGFFGSYTDYG